MYTITIKKIFKISSDKTIYSAKFNFEFTPRVGMNIKINEISCRIVGMAEKAWPGSDDLMLNKQKYLWDLLLLFSTDFTPTLDVPYKLEIPSIGIFNN